MRRTRKQKTFYETINDKWLSDTPLPNTESRITQTYFIREVINKELESIIYRTKDGPIAEIREAWNNATKLNVPYGMSSILMLMQKMVGNRDISERIGWMRRSGMNAPLNIYVQGDPRDHTKCRIFIEEGMPSIGIPEYWLERNHASTRAQYSIYCKSLAKTMGIPNISMGYEAEEEMAHQYPKGTDRWEIYNRINMLTWKELTTIYTTINWSAMFVAYGLNEEDLPGLLYNVTSPSFVHRLQTRMKAWSVERWQGWFSLVAAQWIAGRCPHGPLRSAWFAFKAKFLEGMKQDQPPAKLSMENLYSLLPQTLGHLWVKEFCQHSLQQNIVRMVKVVQGAAANCFRRTEWMSDKTKKAAIKKLRMMNIQMAWPSQWDDTERGCTLNDNLVDNLLTLASNRTDINIHRLRKGCSKHDLLWDCPAYEVNAFYYPEQNKFVMPAAIMRDPFYNPTRSAAWNYGGIGATIGHEISHGFDSDGRRYDEHGDLRDWWTQHDAHQYKLRASRLTKLFDTATYRGMSVQGYLTLVENIADLVGLRFALEGLKEYLNRGLNKNETREFFTSYAVSWRSKDRLEKAKKLLEMDVHAPPMLRVNLIVGQFDEWYDAFDISSDHPNFVKPENRIRIFG
jgi:predicted metalloendopeptidase